MSAARRARPLQDPRALPIPAPVITDERPHAWPPESRPRHCTLPSQARATRSGQQTGPPNPPAVGHTTTHKGPLLSPPPSPRGLCHPSPPFFLCARRRPAAEGLALHCPPRHWRAAAHFGSSETAQQHKAGRRASGRFCTATLPCLCAHCKATSSGVRGSWCGAAPRRQGGGAGWAAGRAGLGRAQTAGSRPDWKHPAHDRRRVSAIRSRL